jgi:hypothetical protein
MEKVIRVLLNMWLSEFGKILSNKIRSSILNDYKQNKTSSKNGDLVYVTVKFRFRQSIISGFRACKQSQNQGQDSRSVNRVKFSGCIRIK